MDRLTFVYDADGSLVGELRYWFGTLFGAEHCSLCDLTHHRWGRRKDFAACAERLAVPIEYVHRDDLDERLRAVAGRLPTVLGHRGEEVEVLLGPDELAGLHGDVGAFELVLREAMAR